MIIRVYYADTDALGIVYHANYLRYFEMARTEKLRGKDFGVQFVVAQALVKYHKPARLNDRLQIVTKIKEFGRASIIFQQAIYYADNNDVLLCEAEIKLVTINQAMRPVAVPESLKMEIDK